MKHQKILEMFQKHDTLFIYIYIYIYVIFNFLCIHIFHIRFDLNP
jgi:hypothetical protein